MPSSTGQINSNDLQEAGLFLPDQFAYTIEISTIVLYVMVVRNRVKVTDMKCRL